MTILNATIALAVAAVLEGSADLSSVKSTTNFAPSLSLASGTGAGQANELFSDQRTLAASATENLDLSGVLTDAFGTAIVFTKVKAIIVRAAAANTNDVLVGGAASNAFVGCFGDATDVIKVKPGGLLVITAPDANGMAVTAGTGDILTVTNSGAGTGVTYDIIVIGVV